jgi:hypothetical protein
MHAFTHFTTGQAYVTTLIPLGDPQVSCNMAQLA